MNSFSIKNILSRAWNLAVDNWPIFLLLYILKTAVEGLGVNVNTDLLNEFNLDKHPEKLSIALGQAIQVNSVLVVLGQILTVYLGIVTYRMLINTIRTGKPYESMGDVFKVDFVHFAMYLAVYLVYEVALTIGLFMCIIPGIFIGVRWMFAPIIMATENVKFSEAFGMSWQMTKGHFWDLILLGIVACLVIVVGFLACCVGVLFAYIIVYFMLAMAYTDLKDANQQQIDMNAFNTYQQ